MPFSGARSIFNRIDNDLARVDAEIAELTAYREGLVIAKESIAAAIPSSVSETNGHRVTNTNGGPSRIEVVENALRMSNRPMTANDVRDVLQTQGRTEDRSSVAAAIAYLAKRGRARSTARGLWMTTAYDDDTTESATDNGEPAEPAEPAEPKKAAGSRKAIAKAAVAA